jgi:hypothetical protein
VVPSGREIGAIFISIFKFTVIEVTMPRLPVFIETLDKLRILHEAKNADYASDSNPLSNFEFTAYILSQAIKHGVTPRYLPYISHIATKLARTINLLGNERKPNNESILDTFNDMACYSILMKCEYLKDRDNANQT